MPKNTKMLLILGAVVIVGWLGWSFLKGRAAGKSANSGTGGTISGTGSNLNSVAPDLVAGASAGGTIAEPGANIPVNVTVNQSAPPGSSTVPMLGTNAVTPIGITTQATAAAAQPGLMTPDASAAMPQPQPVDATVPSGMANTAATAPISNNVGVS